MRLTTLFVLILISSSCTLFFSCDNKKNSESKSEVYFFPEKNVYYNAFTSMYYYSLDNAIAWDSTKREGNASQAHLGKVVTISNPNQEVYKDNLVHREKYNAVVYNIIQPGAKGGNAAPLITERTIIKKPNSDGRLEETAPPKKGLGKFLDKIFGKKKKK